jgi:CheY-like chemotaxis protein
MSAGRRIFLAIEDDPIGAMLLGKLFKEAPPNTEFRLAVDGIEAIRYLEGKGRYADRVEFPLPDAILLDINLPRFDGFDFLEWLRLKGPEPFRAMPVVVMSSSAMTENVERGRALGISAYLLKPPAKGSFWKELEKLGLLDAT